MPADFSPYVDLRIFDAEPADIYLDAIELARLTLPEFNLRVGTPEDAIFQAAAYISSLNISSINRLPDRLMEGIVRLLGLARQDAVAAEVDVTVTLDSYLGGTIPSGTIFSYETLFEDEVQEFVFQTTETILVEEIEDPDEETPLPTASVSAVCLSPGVIPPITTPGTTLKVLSSGTNILSVETFDNFANGINAESDTDYLSRATTYLRSLTSALNKASQLDAYILTNYPGVVGRVKTYDLTNGDEVEGDVTIYRTDEIITTYLENDLATVELGKDTQFWPGDIVTIDGCGPDFDGEREIIGTINNTISFVSVAGNSASAAATGTVVAGEDRVGYATVFAYGLNTFLTEEEKNQILIDISEMSVAGLSFSVRDPEIVNMSLVGYIVIDPTFDQTELQESIENTVVSYLSPNNFPYEDGRVRKTKLISLISNIPGVVYVDGLTLFGDGSDGWLPYSPSSDDLIFTKKGSLPVISTANIMFSYELAPE